MSAAKLDGGAFGGVEHIAVASPNPLGLAQWYVDHLAFRIIYEYSGNYFIKAQHLIQRAHPLPD